MKIIVSACLCGINCKYDGGNNLKAEVKKLVQDGIGIPVCPEQLGGQATPRIPHEIINSSGENVLEGTAFVKGPEGDDVSQEFIKGAEETLEICKMSGAEYAILKARSPSCGCGTIYDGNFKGDKKKGDGVTTALLKKNGIKVYTEEDMEDLINLLDLA